MLSLLLLAFHVVAVCIWVSAIVIGTTSFLGEWLLLSSFFVVCCLLLLDSTLQGSNPAPVLGPFGAS
jgi:membrane-bound metal-dependent hydrolase YbcI (DUF457 family)